MRGFKGTIGRPGARMSSTRKRCLIGRLALFVASIFGGSFPAASALACDCGPPGTPAEAVERAHVVFRGVALLVEEVRAACKGNDPAGESPATVSSPGVPCSYIRLRGWVTFTWESSEVKVLGGRREIFRSD